MRWNQKMSKTKNLKLKLDSNITIPNYFDSKDFSSNNYKHSTKYHEKREYKKAVEYMCESNSIYADTLQIYLAAHQMI